jgi:glucosamine-6-phosphate deaminase
MSVRVVRADGFGGAVVAAFLEMTGEFVAPAVGLATGNTPVPFYTALRARVAAGAADVSAMRPFAIDEYVSDAGHPCSNRTFFARYWDAIPGARPVEQFDPAADDLDTEADRFARQLNEAGGLDVVVLGIGMNGHLAFNEPGTARERRAGCVTLTPATRESAAACWGASQPTLGLTLGLAEMLAARRLLLIANGAKKAAIVARALEGPAGPECPASFVREHPGATIVIDEGAAGELEQR